MPKPPNLKYSLVLRLSDRDRDAFLAELENPAPPNAHLVKAFVSYRSALASGELVSEDGTKKLSATPPSHSAPLPPACGRGRVRRG